MLRPLILSLAFLAFGLISARATEIGDDGLHKEEWFSITFRNVADDIDAARAEGKRLVMIYEQRGCIYCRKMHEVFFADPEIRDYVKANFMVVQYNLFGDEEVTDLDGDVLTEKTAARKWGYIFTPTIVFMPEDPPEGVPVSRAAVATMPGLFGKWTFLDMFHWVREKGYERDMQFQRYRAEMIAKRRAEGIPGAAE